MELSEWHRFVFNKGFSKEKRLNVNRINLRKYHETLKLLSQKAKTHLYTIVLLQYFRDIIGMNFNDNSDLFLSEFYVFPPGETLKSLIAAFSPSNKSFKYNCDMSPFNVEIDVETLMKTVDIRELNNGYYFFTNLDIYSIDIV